MKTAQSFLSLTVIACICASAAAMAKTTGSVFSPKKGVICDTYICAYQMVYFATRKLNCAMPTAILIKTASAVKLIRI